MLEEAVEQGFKIAFYLGSGAILATFAILTLVEGLLAQTANFEFSAVVFYFISMCSLGAAYWTYSRTKKVLKTLN